jgi:hypothetical protein
MGKIIGLIMVAIGGYDFYKYFLDISKDNLIYLIIGVILVGFGLYNLFSKPKSPFRRY